MNIYDCFLYNGETEIVSLRFEVMGPYIEKFVIVEANKTFSGLTKPFYFERDMHLWQKWKDKILFFPISNLLEGNDVWAKEHFLRDQLRLLVPASDDDLISIADADEIINIPAIANILPLTEPTIVELPTYYHFLNVQSSEIIKVTLIAPFKTVKNTFLGDRNTYLSFAKNRISAAEYQTGGHFTYMFGYNVNNYIKKIQTFSHQEFNTPYWLNSKRIKACIAYDIDLFERRQFKYKQIDLKKEFPVFYNELTNLPGFTQLIKPMGVSAFLNQLGRFLNLYFLKYQYLNLRIKLSYFKKRLLIHD
jgi:beta-1,4-mannosyl-glycoprotein beta-1,4-N-acetylglucosaminyltransferase